MPTAYSTSVTPTAAPAASAAAVATGSLEIFRAGRHTAVDGQTLAFSELDLAATARAYNPVLHEAPLVVGHPRLDMPAYGWVGAVRAQGAALDVVPRDVDPAFAELVNGRRYSKISAAFYAPDAPGNPVPGVYYLKHVGFLGAAAPAVKGLRTPTFAGDSRGVVEFSEWDDVTNASLWRRMREWLVGRFGLDEADRVVPGYEVQALEAGAQDELRTAQQATAASQPPGFAFAAPPTSPFFPPPLLPQGDTPMTEAERQELARLQADNQRLQQQAGTLLQQQQQAQRAGVHAGHVAFAESLVVQARLAVADAPVVAQALTALAMAGSGETPTPGAASSSPLMFGEGAAAVPLHQALRQTLAALPVRVELQELATAARAAPAGAVLAFAAPAGATASPDKVQLDAKVRAHMRAHSVSYQAALDVVLAAGG